MFVLYAKFLFTFSILWHKVWILYYGYKVGLPVRLLLIHDLNKFTSKQFGAYALHYATRRGFIGVVPNSLVEYFIQADFRKAHEEHGQSNKHHYGYWESRHTTMPDESVCEMVVDWLAATRVYSGKPAPRELSQWDWWTNNRQKFMDKPYIDATKLEFIVRIVHTKALTPWRG